jgi:hypothetical protein
VSRALLAVIACLCLTGCWVSEKDLFGSGDWARLDLDGRYAVESSTELGAPSEVTVTMRADGVLAIVPELTAEDSGEPLMLGLVPIPGGSGDYFLAADLSEDGETAFYLVAHRTLAGELALYLPDCAGTSPRDDLVIEEESKGGLTCGFSGKAALLDAALEAERFLSVRHIVALSPLYLLKPEVEGGDEAAE